MCQGATSNPPPSEQRARIVLALLDGRASTRRRRLSEFGASAHDVATPVVRSIAMDALDDALRVIASLNRVGVDYVVVGGVALNVHSDLEYEEKEVAGVRIRVATPATLYRMKRDTVRPIDRADALALRSAFDLEDEEER